MKRIVLLFVFIATMQCVNAENIRFRGRVVDAAGVPIIGATVIATTTRRGTVTNSDGRFDFRSGDCVQTKVEVSMIGYITYTSGYYGIDHYFGDIVLQEDNRRTRADINREKKLKSSK